MTFRAFDSFSKKGRGNFKGFGTNRRSPFKKPPDDVPDAFDPTDDTEDRWARVLGDRATAKRVQALSRQYPAGSLPELVVMDWLDRHYVKYQYQVPLGGGRSLRGGQVLDFLVVQPGGMLVIRVMGYYHEQPAQEGVDAAQRLHLQRTKVQGQRVKAVADVWERRLLDSKLRDETMQNALKGIEVGR